MAGRHMLNLPPPPLSCRSRPYKACKIEAPPIAERPLLNLNHGSPALSLQAFTSFGSFIFPGYGPEETQSKPRGMEQRHLSLCD